MTPVFEIIQIQEYSFHLITNGLLNWTKLQFLDNSH